MFKWMKKQGAGAADTTKKLMAYESTKNFTTATLEIAKTTFSPKEAIANARIETFAEAQKRLGVSDLDLAKNYRNFAWTVIISVFGFLLMAIFSLISAYQGKFLNAFPSFALGLCMLAYSFKFSFRAYQIRHKSLCGVSKWLSAYKEWIPDPFI